MLPSISSCTVTPGMAAALRHKSVRAQSSENCAGPEEQHLDGRLCRSAWAIRRFNSSMLARVQGHRGWANMIKVSRLGSSAIWASDGHCRGCVPAPPAVF